ncbi:2-succinyl-5-enolpyruvyl-6-hydroxy-3-cyclohexene-1-carboxylate synthase [Eubacterium sp. AM05-23]|uniref:thiamine pyrophosphate-binding protein n=1 Tax=Eubacterium TaxID=1730 RepID=UPI000E4B0690|nr:MULTISPECIES: thiamine pyrophosphate-binding protein [Eubacterium]RHO57199.1 2-succinyl-5-enolpyruvyl-6-hydroxy-3-cyclohexene-1-carboxylate synthase [Eubacterium sp. AM05-23]
MNVHYSLEENTLILISLLKKHKISKIIVSPGSTNIAFAASVQQDDFFELYSCVDERSAAYMACGLSAESNEPVVISCTGATASRNYMPGLTEAFYRGLPILAVTSSQPIERIGHNIPQVLDRTVVPNDVVKNSVKIPFIYNEEQRWATRVKINDALLALTHNGKGPVHIELTTLYTPDFSVKSLPEYKMINKYSSIDDFPSIKSDKVAIFIGAHIKLSNELTREIEIFCEKYNGVVLCDHTSNYWGKYRVLPNILCSQKGYTAKCRNIPLLIHIGEMSGAYLSIYPSQVWRIHEDGKLKDTYKKLTCVFETTELNFFRNYNANNSNSNNISYYNVWRNECDDILLKVPDLPFSNAWIAQNTSGSLPTNSVIHFGILNSLRSWNYFELPNNTMGYCNTGGFGIDGGVSSLVGASLFDKNKLYFGVFGDLLFFYDMNSIGNRHISNNVRILVVNNGKGNEFRNYGNWASQLGDYADDYIAAAGHFGNKSKSLIKDLSLNLGFDYISASNKNEYISNLNVFVSEKISEKPIVFEVFTETEEESKALELIYNIRKTAASYIKESTKSFLGDKGTDKFKKMYKSLKGE